MQAALRTTTRVLPGRRIAVTLPELRDGEEVELIVLRPRPGSARPANYISAVDFLDSLPPSSLTVEDWERIENELREEKAAWDR